MELARRIVEPEETENCVIIGWAQPRANWSLSARIGHAMQGFFPEIEIAGPDALFEREKAAFQAMMPGLSQQHPGKYVAVHSGRVQVIASTEAEAVRNFFERFGDTHVYIGHTGDTTPETYQVSPISFG